MSTLNATAIAEIRAELARQRLSQRELGLSCGIGEVPLNRRLTGHVPLTLPDLEAIAAALGVSPTALLTGQRPTPAEVS